MIKISIAGDFCPRNRLESLILQEQYESVLGDVKHLFETSDLSIVNLEAPCAPEHSRPIRKDGPCLKCTEKAVASLRYAGVNMVTLANNHLNDYGADGVLNTIDVCKRYRIGYVGAGANDKQASETYFQTIQGRRFAIINCCEHEFSIATSDSPGANHISPIKIYNQISSAKKRSDYIIVITHGGHEHFQLPSPRMKELYRFFVDAGADAVINHHQHCISGYEIYKGKPIAYGIGNFCFDRVNTFNDKWNDGVVACLEFENENVAIKLKPIIQCSQKPCVIVATGEDKQRINKEISELNLIIENDRLLGNHYQKYLKAEDRTYSIIFEPYGGRLLSALYRRRILPSLVCLSKSCVNYGFVMCESHFDIVKHHLLYKYKKWNQ